MPDPAPRSLRRRDLLKVGAVGLFGLAALRVAARAVAGTAPPPISHDPARLKLLSPRQEAVVTAAARVMAGPSAEAAYGAGVWDPAADIDALLGHLAPDQAKMLGFALLLLEESTWSARGFSGLERAEQEQVLLAWSSSGLALKRSVWGFLHSAAASSWSGSQAGWALLGYPGPCRPGPAGPGRQPGQLARFSWDEVVP